MVELHDVLFHDLGTHMSVFKLQYFIKLYP